MYVDPRCAQEYVGTVVYKSFNPKTLYVIDSVKEVRDFDIFFIIKDEKGVLSNVSSLQLKDITQLIEDTATKLKNHQARYWAFTTKLGMNK